MKLQFTFKHLDPSDSLQEYTRHRLNDISQFLLKEGMGHVYFSKSKGEFLAEVNVNSRQKYLKPQRDLWTLPSGRCGGRKAPEAVFTDA